MPTLWEMLTKPKPVEIPLELQYYNPLKLRIGVCVKVDTLDYEKLTFTLRSIKEYTRKLGGVKHQFVDYNLVAQPLEGGPVFLTLRLIPEEDSADGTTHSVILLEKISDCGYDKTFHEGLVNDTFIEEDATYWRVNEATSEWTADVVELSLNSKKNKVTAKNSSVDYWDFWRTTKDVADQDVLEFYIVEMNKSDGFFTFLMGPKVNSERIGV